MANVRLQELDALRGIAALAVVIFHFTHGYNKLYTHQFSMPFEIFNYGRFGVQLFFIISGFVIFLTLERTKRPLDFIVSRFSRLYPTYWSSVIIIFSVLYFFPLPDRHPELGIAIANLSMIQNWFGVKDLEVVYWTLAFELSFYFSMFFLYITRMFRYIDVIAVTWLCIIILAYLFKEKYGGHISYSLQMLLLLDYGHLFISGIFFYKLKSTQNNNYLLVIAFCLLIEYLMYYNVVYNKDSATSTTAFFLIFFLFVKGKLKFIAARPLVFLGSVSYSLYLLHVSIGFVAINFIYKYTTSSLLVIGGATVFVISIAVLIHKYVEKPSLILIRSIYKGS